MHEDTEFHPADFRPAEDPDTRTVRFPQGIPGFPEDRDYLLSPLGEDGAFQDLCAEDPRGPAFVVIDPLLLDPSFSCEVDDAALRSVGLTGLGEGAGWLAIVTLPRDDGPAWVNLRSPLLVNLRDGIGVQLIPERSRYGLREPLPLRIARVAEEVGACAGLD